MPINKIELLDSVNNMKSKLDTEKSNIFWLKDGKQKMFEEEIYPKVYNARIMGANNLTHTLIHVNVQTLDTLDSSNITGLLDNSATHSFINEGFVHHH